MKWIWKIWPMKNYAAITTPWGVFVNPECEGDEEVLRHENVHLEQIKKLGAIRFYSQYLYEYLKGWIKYRNHWDAYMNISFEIEAREKSEE